MSDFNPDDFIKQVTPSFDPDAFVAADPAPIGVGESALRGVGQGASLGFADEIAGAGGALYKALKNRSLDTLSKDYAAGRDKYRSEDAAARASNPKTFIGGELGGGVLTGFAPGIGIAKGASTVKNLSNLVAQGVLQGIGSSESDTVGGNVADAAKGGAAGLVGAGAGRLVSKLIPNAVQTGKYATSKAIEHLRPTPKVARVLGPERLAAVGQEALDSGAIQFGSKAADTAERLAGQRDVIGKEIGGYIDEAGKAGRTVDPATVAQKFQSEVIDPLKGQAANKANVAKLEQQKADFLEHYGGDANLTPLQIEEEKRAVQGGINYLTDPKAAQEAQMGYANVLKNAGEGAVNNPLFKTAKDRFGKVADAQMMAERTAGLTDGTGMFQKLHDLSAEQIAAQALIHGEPLTAAAVGGARALARGRVKSAQAVGADLISKYLQKNPTLNKAAMGAEALVSRVAPVAARQNAPYNKATAAPAEVIGSLASTPGGAGFAAHLAQAAAKGEDEFSAQYFLMSQDVPKFRQLMEEQDKQR